VRPASGEPVLDGKAGDSAEFANVVSHEDGVQTERMHADLGIERTDWRSGFLERSPDARILEAAFDDAYFLFWPLRAVTLSVFYKPVVV
jgi:hypothetical protein